MVILVRMCKKMIEISINMKNILHLKREMIDQSQENYLGPGAGGPGAGAGKVGRGPGAGKLELPKNGKRTKNVCNNIITV